jgi:hypothetical protein
LQIGELQRCACAVTYLQKFIAKLQLCDAPHVFNGLFAMTIASRVAALTETSERCA